MAGSLVPRGTILTSLILHQRKDYVPFPSSSLAVIPCDVLFWINLSLLLALGCPLGLVTLPTLVIDLLLSNNEMGTILGVLFILLTCFLRGKEQSSCLLRK